MPHSRIRFLLTCALALCLGAAVRAVDAAADADAALAGLTQPTKDFIAAFDVLRAEHAALKVLLAEAQANLADQQAAQAALTSQLATRTSERDTAMATIKTLRSDLAAALAKLPTAALQLETGAVLAGGPDQVLTYRDRWEAFTGRPAAWLAAFASGEGWSTSAAQFGAGSYWRPRLAKAERPWVIAFPLGPKTPTAAVHRLRDEINTGAKDAEFRREAAEWARLGTGPQPVRYGWECNGDWYEWSEEAAAYGPAFRRVVEIFRAESPRFVAVWNVNVYSGAIAPYWPGRPWVDEISMDLYFRGGDAAAAFAALRDHPTSGLNVIADLAVAEGLPLSFDELGVVADSGAFVDLLAAWIQTRRDVQWRRLVWWDKNDEVPCAISAGQSGTTGERYRAHFNVSNTNS